MFGADVDHDLRALFPNNQTCFNFVVDMFNQVKYLYDNEGVNALISELVIWTNPSPYQGNNGSEYLNSYKENRVKENANAYILLSGKKSYGGYAFQEQLCSNFSFAFCGMNSTYNSAPVYSNSVYVVTHEIGHLLGSRHTHNCTWPGGPIDNCYAVEGACAEGPSPTGGGTIMSYCHLTSKGIDFNLGFGTLPGDKIRSVVEAKACVVQCSGTSSLGLSELTAENSIKIYPNPSNGMLSIDMSELPEAFDKITIYLADGRMAYQELISGQHAFSADLSVLSAGTYLITLTNQMGSTITERWVKSK